MTTATLFGLALAPLYAAIAQVESDRGATSSNVYQIRKIYVDDVNRIISHDRIASMSFDLTDNRSKARSEIMMHIYWRHWGIHYQQKTGKPVTYEVLARIHNGGPLGWKKPETLAYWQKVKAIMEGGAK